MLFVDQHKGAALDLIGCLQKALSKQNLALLNQAPEGVVPHFIAPRHLFGLPHQLE